jgi:glycosyltransferase involved in cell wall biosynthesis
MIYLEPAPYIVGFVEHVRHAWTARIDTAYVATSVSQPWGHQIQSDREFVLPQGFGRAVAEIRRRIASGDHRLVHLAGWGHPILIAALLLAKLYRLPVTMESDTPRPTNPAGWKRAIKRLLYPRLFSLPNFFLPGGTRQAAYLRDYGVEVDRLKIVQMTVDVEQIRSRIGGRRDGLRSGFRERFRIGKNAVCALYVGRLEPHKGIEDLLQSFRTASCRSLLLLIVGDGSLRDVVREAEARSIWLRYAGRLSGDELWAAYAAADFLVLPSRVEPWGLVVNEAMAAGLPVVVSDRAGCIDDIVENEITGLVVPAESPSHLARAMVRLAEDMELRTRLGDQGSRLISGWTLAAQAANTTAVWSLALEGR